MEEKMREVAFPQGCPPAKGETRDFLYKSMRHDTVKIRML